MKSQVTTKQGDKGQTRALDGEVYSKGHIIVECMGALDELRAHLALSRLLALERKPEKCEAVAEFLTWLLHTCFVLGATCADPKNRRPERHPMAIGPREVERIEHEQAELEKTVRLPQAFILSASNLLAAQVDLACTIARRFERNLVRLTEQFPELEAAHLLVFANRLSDYLFILARHLDAGNYETVDYSALA